MGTRDFECHAGLTCRAVPVEDRARRFVAIVGLTFTSSENYRNATEKAISGEWSGFKPTEAFENILMSGSTSGIERVAKGLEKFAAREPDDVLEIETPPVAQAPELDEMVRRCNERTPAETPVSPPIENPAITPVSVSALRSLVGNLMHFDYREGVCGGARLRS